METANYESGQSFQKPHKKKKKSFLQKTKKFGKSGRFGRGQEIDASTYNYFVQVLSTLNANDFEDDEAKEIFVANVFASNENSEELLCCNQLVSRIYEKLLPLASNTVKMRFMNKLGGDDIRKYASNQFASHGIDWCFSLYYIHYFLNENWSILTHLFSVLETLLWLGAFKQSQDAKNEDIEKYEAERKKWALKICKYCVNNFADFAFDSYASHILKTGFQVRFYWP